MSATSGPRPWFLIIAIAALVALPIATGLSGTTRWRAALNDAGHAPLFAALAWLLYRLLRQFPSLHLGDVPALRHCAAPAIVFAVSLAIGGAVELLQAVIGRGASAFDMLMDAAGAAFALAWVAWRESPTSRPLARAGFAGIAAMSILIVLAPLMEVGGAYLHRARAWPSLLSEAQWRDGKFLAATGGRLQWAPVPSDWVRRSNERGLELQFSGRSVPGIRWEEPIPDWRGFDALELELVNPTEGPLHWMLRIHDAEHDQRHDDRFNRPIDLPARTRQTVRIALGEMARAPVGRTLDLSRIRGVALFERSPAQGLAGSIWVIRADLIG